LSKIDALANLPLTHIFVGQTSINPHILKSFKYLSHLKEISLKAVNLTSIPPIFSDMVQLVELKLSDNKINKIENIENLIHLKSLDLRANQIEVMENM
jgi:Leucine-rich repeat (LRR) protein